VEIDSKELYLKMFESVYLENSYMVEPWVIVFIKLPEKKTIDAGAYIK
jgi:hypothetical protein